MHKDSQDTIFFSIVAFAGGVLAGMLLAPDSGRATRQSIARKARAQTRWMEQRIRQLEHQIETLEDQVADVGHEMSQRIQDVTDRFVPHPEDWSVEKTEVVGELGRMPRQ